MLVIDGIVSVAGRVRVLEEVLQDAKALEAGVGTTRADPLATSVDARVVSTTTRITGFRITPVRPYSRVHIRDVSLVASQANGHAERKESKRCRKSLSV
jgi:hypothetical protein